MAMYPPGPWLYPPQRYYYGWYGDPVAQEPTDHEIKSSIVDRLRENPLTSGETIKVDVKQSVVVLGGFVSSTLAKRAAGDDAWDTRGVADVSNQLEIARDAA